MPKFSAYLRGEGVEGPVGPIGPTGPVGPSQKILFDVDVTTGELIMYTDYNIFDIDPDMFTLDETGHLVVSVS